MKILINHIEAEVSESTTVLEAALLLGFQIPTMCYLKDHSNHPSCMICMVEDEKTGHMFPSCAMPVKDGMSVLTDTAGVHEMRRQALSLLLSDHLGDCEAPCRLSCPAFMNIPEMNRFIANGDTAGALRIVREEIAIPLVLGHICPAPCEKACHRRSIDKPVRICSLKKFAAEHPSYLTSVPVPSVKSGKKVAVIGTGPAGLSAAFYLLKAGHDCVLYDKDEQPGGTLKAVPENRLPKEAIDKEIQVISAMGGRIELNFKVEQSSFPELQKRYDATILATGFNPEIEDLSLPDNFFICGNPGKEEKMAVRSAAAGKHIALEIDNIFKAESDHKKKYAFRKNNISRAGKLQEEDQQEYLKECPVVNETTDEMIKAASECMHCDCRKADSCKLRIYGHEYSAGKIKLFSSVRKKITKELQHETVVYEAQKCIKCGLCVDISAEDKNSFGLAFYGRGYDVEIKPSLDSVFAESLRDKAEECVKACPTGALSFKKD